MNFLQYWEFIDTGVYLLTTVQSLIDRSGYSEVNLPRGTGDSCEENNKELNVICKQSLE